MIFCLMIFNTLSLTATIMVAALLTNQTVFDNISLAKI